MVKETKALQDIKALKANLEKAIQAEEFEEAARLRDKIREMEGKPRSGDAQQ
jgi:protein arginine kinase activator